MNLKSVKRAENESRGMIQIGGVIFAFWRLESQLDISIIPIGQYFAS